MAFIRSFPHSTTANQRLIRALNARRPTPNMALTAHIDHIAFDVKDLHKVLTFYTQTLNFAPLNIDEYYAGKAHFPSVRVSPTTILDFFKTDDQHQPTGLSRANHVCFTIDKADFSHLRQRLIEAGIQVKDPVPRSGARGQGNSIYIHDPENNMLEFRYYD